MTESNQFPQLNQSALISFAAEVAKFYKEVKRITLHHGRNDNRYVLLFWLGGEPVPRAEIPNFNQSPQNWPDNNTAVSMERTIIWKEPIYWKSFADVYQNGMMPAGYVDEWSFYPIFDGEDIPSFVSLEYCELFSDGDQKLDVPGFVKKCRNEGMLDDVIAYKLYDKEGDFGLIHLECARALGLDNNEIHVDVLTLKQRGRRACVRGKKILEGELKK